MKRKFIKYTLLVATLALVVAGGIFATRNDAGLGRNMEIMVNLMRAIATEYVDEVDADEMMRNGADGITSKLDPYTSFIPEEDMPVRLEISAVSLADMLDLGRASLYRAMDRLSQDGFLVRNGHEYRLLQRDKLLTHYQ